MKPTTNTPIHLAKYLHDVTAECTEIWCSDPEPFGDLEATERFSRVTCLACIEAAVAFGRVAEERMREIVPADGP